MYTRAAMSGLPDRRVGRDEAPVRVGDQHDRAADGLQVAGEVGGVGAGSPQWVGRGATTVKPWRCNLAMTSLHEEPSAQSPCTSTIVRIAATVARGPAVNSARAEGRDQRRNTSGPRRPRQPFTHRHGPKHDPDGHRRAQPRIRAIPNDRTERRASRSSACAPNGIDVSFRGGAGRLATLLGMGSSVPPMFARCHGSINRQYL